MHGNHTKPVFRSWMIARHRSGDCLQSCNGGALAVVELLRIQSAQQRHGLRPPKPVEPLQARALTKWPSVGVCVCVLLCVPWPLPSPLRVRARQTAESSSQTLTTCASRKCARACVRACSDGDGNGGDGTGDVALAESGAIAKLLNAINHERWFLPSCHVRLGRWKHGNQLKYLTRLTSSVVF